MAGELGLLRADHRSRVRVVVGAFDARVGGVPDGSAGGGVSAFYAGGACRFVGCARECGGWHSRGVGGGAVGGGGVWVRRVAGAGGGGVGDAESTEALEEGRVLGDGAGGEEVGGGGKF